MRAESRPGSSCLGVSPGQVPVRGGVWSRGEMGCQWASSDSGEEVALRWGEGGVKKRGWAKLERFSAGRKAVEKKKYPTLGLIGSLVSFSGNKESEREPNTKLLGCCKISGLSLSLFFFFSWWRVGISPLSCPQLRKRKNGLCFTNGQTVRPRSNVCFSPQKPCCTTWCYFHRQLK